MANITLLGDQSALTAVNTGQMKSPSAVFTNPNHGRVSTQFTVTAVVASKLVFCPSMDMFRAATSKLYGTTAQNYILADPSYAFAPPLPASTNQTAVFTQNNYEKYQNFIALAKEAAINPYFRIATTAANFNNKTVNYAAVSPDSLQNLNTDIDDVGLQQLVSANNQQLITFMAKIAIANTTYMDIDILAGETLSFLISLEPIGGAPVVNAY